MYLKKKMDFISYLKKANINKLFHEHNLCYHCFGLDLFLKKSCSNFLFAFWLPEKPFRSFPDPTLSFRSFPYPTPSFRSFPYPTPSFRSFFCPTFFRSFSSVVVFISCFRFSKLSYILHSSSFSTCNFSFSNSSSFPSNFPSVSGIYGAPFPVLSATVDLQYTEKIKKQVLEDLKKRSSNPLDLHDIYTEKFLCEKQNQSEKELSNEFVRNVLNELKVRCAMQLCLLEQIRFSLLLAPYSSSLSSILPTISSSFYAEQSIKNGSVVLSPLLNKAFNELVDIYKTIKNISREEISESENNLEELKYFPGEKLSRKNLSNVEIHEILEKVKEKHSTLFMLVIAACRNTFVKLKKKAYAYTEKTMCAADVLKNPENQMTRNVEEAGKIHEEVVYGKMNDCVESDGRIITSSFSSSFLFSSVYSSLSNNSFRFQTNTKMLSLLHVANLDDENISKYMKALDKLIEEFLLRSVSCGTLLFFSSSFFSIHRNDYLPVLSFIPYASSATTNSNTQSAQVSSSSSSSANSSYFDLCSLFSSFAATSTPSSSSFSSSPHPPRYSFSTPSASYFEHAQCTRSKQNMYTKMNNMHDNITNISYEKNYNNANNNNNNSNSNDYCKLSSYAHKPSQSSSFSHSSSSSSFSVISLKPLFFSSGNACSPTLNLKSFIMSNASQILNVFNIVGRRIQNMSLKCFGACPSIHIHEIRYNHNTMNNNNNNNNNGNNNICFPSYILEYVTQEILKNAVLATLRKCEKNIVNMSEVYCTFCVESNGGIWLRVSDSGGGIDKESINKIFSCFFSSFCSSTSNAFYCSLFNEANRVRNTATNKPGNFSEIHKNVLIIDNNNVKGTLESHNEEKTLNSLLEREREFKALGGFGIGLALCKAYLNYFGGDIFLKNSEGSRGVDAYIYIPSLKYKSMENIPKCTFIDDIDESTIKFLKGIFDHIKTVDSPEKKKKITLAE